MTKNEIADVLAEIGTLLELKGENPFKVRAYQSGARALEAIEEQELARLIASDELQTVKGIGEALGQKISAIPRIPKADSKPSMPDPAYSNSQILASLFWAVWWVVMQSMVPSFTAARSAWRSFSVRRGGFTLRLVSYPFSNDMSVKTRWYGVVEQVILRPSFFAFLIISTEVDKLIPVRCNLEWVYRNNSMSLATMISSARAGFPGSPTWVETMPSCISPCGATE